LASVNDAAALARLAGAYRLRPGGSPAIVGERPVLEARRLSALLRGLPPACVPDTCAAVFTLCSHAHRRNSEAAVAAALGLAPVKHGALLACETARDHLRTTALDWPARAGLTPELAWLRDAPLRIGGPAPSDADAARQVLRALAEWLTSDVLHATPREWLARCREADGLRGWCEQEADALQPARCLAMWHARAHALRVACEPLRVLGADAERWGSSLRSSPPAYEDNPQTVRELASALATEPRFAQFPTWRGEARENGPWTRRRHADADLPSTAWMRIAARWIELVELAAGADDESLLQSGALALGDHAAIAWCEMARGLLFHWVRLEADSTVADYRVLAPTEWNFHPQGALARALEALPANDDPTAQLLAAAFDPCVPCSVAAP
jgi:hypothetical protein